MKYLFRALAHEIIGFLLIFAVVAAIGGVGYAAHQLLGEYAFGIGLIVALVAVHAPIVMQKARHLKNRDRSAS